MSSYKLSIHVFWQGCGIDVVDIVVLDVQGKELLYQSSMFDQDRINLSNYVAGTYFVKIITAVGTREVRVTKH